MNVFHSHSIRVYQEDVDGGGMVYHSNYLKYAERARTEWLRGYSLTQSAMATHEKRYFVVTGLTLRYLKPAFLDDELEVRSEKGEIRGIRLVIPQKIYRHTVLCVDMMVTLALINNHGKPVRLPLSLREIFAGSDPLDRWIRTAGQSIDKRDQADAFPQDTASRSPENCKERG